MNYLTKLTKDQELDVRMHALQVSGIAGLWGLLCGASFAVKGVGLGAALAIAGLGAVYAWHRALERPWKAGKKAEEHFGGWW